MLVNKLIPNIDRRLSTWVRIQEQLKEEPHRKPQPTITISRQYGCEGFPLAEALKDLLDRKTGDTWTIFDKTLIDRVSRETALSEGFLANLGDASQAFDALITMLPGLRTHSDAYQILARYIVGIAQAGNAIIVGRGGAVLTQHLPNCFHFRLDAPIEHRIRSIQQRLGIPGKEAKAIVLENQKARDRFLEEFLNCSIAALRYYHSVYNTSKSPIEDIARSILTLVFVSSNEA